MAGSSAFTASSKEMWAASLFTSPEGRRREPARREPVLREPVRELRERPARWAASAARQKEGLAARREQREHPERRAVERADACRA